MRRRNIDILQSISFYSDTIGNLEMCHSNCVTAYCVTVTDVTVNESDSIVCARGRVGVLSFNFRMSDSKLLPASY